MADQVDVKKALAAVQAAGRKIQMPVPDRDDLGKRGHQFHTDDYETTKDSGHRG